MNFRIPLSCLRMDSIIDLVTVTCSKLFSRLQTSFLKKKEGNTSTKTTKYWFCVSSLAKWVLWIKSCSIFTLEIENDCITWLLNSLLPYLLFQWFNLGLVWMESCSLLPYEASLTIGKELWPFLGTEETSFWLWNKGILLTWRWTVLWFLWEKNNFWLKYIYVCPFISSILWTQGKEVTSFSLILFLGFSKLQKSMATQVQSAVSVLLVLNLVLYFIITVIASWAVNHALEKSFESGNFQLTSPTLSTIYNKSEC